MLELLYYLFKITLSPVCFIMIHVIMIQIVLFWYYTTPIYDAMLDYQIACEVADCDFIKPVQVKNSSAESISSRLSRLSHHLNLVGESLA